MFRFCLVNSLDAYLDFVQIGIQNNITKFVHGCKKFKIGICYEKTGFKL